MTKTVPLRHVAEVTLGRMRNAAPLDDPDAVPYLRAANVSDGVLELDDVKSMPFSLTEQMRYRLRTGDVLVTEASGSRSQVGQTARVDGDADGLMFQNTLIRLRARAGVTSEFLYWWARSSYSSGLFAEASQGLGIWHLGAERLAALPITLPSLDGQRRVADFLDDQVALIDRAVQLRKRQGELARSVVASAVDAHFGMEALSSHGAIKVGRFASLIPGFAFSSHEFLEDGSFRLLRGINVGVRRLLDREWAHWSGSDERVAAAFLLRPGDVVMGMDRPWIRDGLRIATVPVESPPTLLVQRVACFRPRGDRLLPNYLYWAYQARRFQDELEAQMTGLSVPHLSGDQILSFRVPDVTVKTQGDVISKLDELHSSATSAEASIEKWVARLEERKQALIMAAVTGEFDVATATARAV